MPRTRFTCRTTPREHLQCSPPQRGQTPCRHSQLWRPTIGPPEGPAPRRLPRLCGARHRPPARGTQFAAAWLAGLPYRVRGAPLPGGGGGLVTLVHACPLSGSQVREHAQEHSLCVHVEPSTCTSRRPCPWLDAGLSSATPPLSTHGRGKCQDHGRRP